MGTQKSKLCAKGLGCEADISRVSLDLPDGMTGETVLSIDATLNENGKKLDGTGELTLSNGDIYNLSAKGKYNRNQEEMKYSLKGVDASSKGIKFTLKINERNGDVNFIRGNAHNQKLKFN